jgi:hypothetical protein
MTTLPCFVGDADPLLARVPGADLHMYGTVWLLTQGETRKTKRVRLFTEFVSRRRRVRAASRGTLFWRLMSGRSPTRLVRPAGCPAKPAKVQTPDLFLTGLLRPHSPHSRRSANGPSPPKRDVGCLYPQCLLRVDTSRELRANSGHSRKAHQTLKGLRSGYTPGVAFYSYVVALIHSNVRRCQENLGAVRSSGGLTRIASTTRGQICPITAWIGAGRRSRFVDQRPNLEGFRRKRRVACGKRDVFVSAHPGRHPLLVLGINHAIVARDLILAVVPGFENVAAAKCEGRPARSLSGVAAHGGPLAEAEIGHMVRLARSSSMLTG